MDTTGTITNFKTTPGTLFSVGGDAYEVETEGKSYSITNSDPQTLRFAFANGQTVQQARNAAVSQRGVNVSLRSRDRIPKGGKVTDVSFTGR